MWLDDAWDNKADAGACASIARKRPNAMLIANPGTKCIGPLKGLGVILCEHESTARINWKSRVIIAFASSQADASKIRSRAASEGVLLVAIEPKSTYHIAGVEYQKPNPFAPTAKPKIDAPSRKLRRVSYRGGCKFFQY